MRRWLYVTIIIAAVVLAVLIGLYFRYRSNTVSFNPEPAPPGGLPPTAPPGFSPPPGATPPPSPTPMSVPGAQKFGRVADNPVRSYYVDAQNNVIIVQPDGQIVKVQNGNATMLSSSVVSNLTNAAFSYDGSKILAVFGDESAPQASLFDVQSKSWIPQAGAMHFPAWSPNDSRIIYLAEKPDGYAITTLDLANPKAKPAELMKIRGEDLLLDWTNPSQALVYQKPSAAVAGSAWVFNIKNKTLTPLLSDRFGLQILWEKTTNVGLVSGNGAGGDSTLSLVAANGQALRDLSLATLPVKCAFEVVPSTSAPSSATTTKTRVPAPLPAPAVSAYCAIPRDAEKFKLAGLPDGYFKRAILTADDFYKVGLGDGAVSQTFADPAQTLDAIDLRIANQNLFFVNRFDEKLYVISLK